MCVSLAERAKEERETMATGAERIAQDMRDIVQTRVAIAEKLGVIERQAGTTMQHAKTVMTELADTTKASVRKTMQVTQQALDPRVHLIRHPWISVGGIVVLGYVVGAIYRRGRRIPTGAVPYYSQGMKGVSDNAGMEQGRPNPSPIWAEAERAIRDELGIVRGGLIGFGRGLLREIVRQAIPALMQRVGGYCREEHPRSTSEPLRR